MTLKVLADLESNVILENGLVKLGVSTLDLFVGLSKSCCVCGEEAEVEDVVVVVLAKETIFLFSRTSWVIVRMKFPLLGSESLVWIDANFGYFFMLSASSHKSTKQRPSFKREFTGDVDIPPSGSRLLMALVTLFGSRVRVYERSHDPFKMTSTFCLTLGVTSSNLR